MKMPGYQRPRSSFLSVDKDLSLLIDKMLENNRLKKLLHYTNSSALSQPALTEEQSLALINKNLKIVPKIIIDKSVLNYVIIGFDNFTPSGNPEYRDNIISFDIICHYDQWILSDSQLRPYKIAAEIDTMFNECRLTGIGTLKFLGANQLIVNEEFAGITLMYAAVHGDEDKNNPLNPADTQDLKDNFNALFNV